MISPQRVPAGRVLLRSVLLCLLSAGWLAAQQVSGKASTPVSEADAASSSQLPGNGPMTKASAAESPSSVAKSAAASAPLQPPPSGFDIQARGHDVLGHLSAVIRYYRTALTPVQKVGEPSDLLYTEQSLMDADQAAQYAFQSARAEAVLLQAYAKSVGAQSGSTPEGEAQRMQGYRATVAERIATIRTQQQAVAAQLQTPKRGQLAVLEQQKEQLDGALELNLAMSDALSKVATSDSQSSGGLAGDIDRLERTAPELQTGKSKPVAQPPLENLGSARSTGVVSQATVLFQLLGSRHAVDARIEETLALRDQAVALRTPLTDVVRPLVQRAQVLSQQAQAAPPPAAVAAKGAKSTATPDLQQQLLATRQSFASVIATFKVLSAASVPLSEEIITLEQSRANLIVWRAAIDSEYRAVLRDLLLRVLAIAIALGVLFVLGEVWRRASVRYVHDTRRRRQLLVMRRIVISFLSGLVFVFGFVTQFNSLATFAGFITAGLAVGLQTILLSVAAYFFIIGRYGVRVGDRITIAGVTGDVIDVGLVRFYMMELAGDGTEMHPTGRVAVFSNSVLFQASTPLYKQMPGTEYAWHEVVVKLALASNYGPASQVILRAVHTVYEDYRTRIESQHRAVEMWLDTPVDTPAIDSRLQLMDDGLQLRVRFPVEIHAAAKTDEQVTESLLQLIRDNAEVKAAVASPPQIRAVIKG